MSFSNKVVLVVGGSSGIGAAAAIKFSKERADVAIVGRNEAKLKDVADKCKKSGKTPFIIIADISNDDEAASVVAKTVEKFKKLDVLVNNAGILSHGTILDGTLLKSFDEVMKINLRALLHLTMLSAPHLIKTEGNVVNISSTAGMITFKMPSINAYCVLKAGLNHFTRCAAFELAPHNVRVNSVCPGPVKTELLIKAGNAGYPTIDDVGAATAFKRISDPGEIADLILFLASDKAQSITGSEHVIDNGLLLTI